MFLLYLFLAFTLIPAAEIALFIFIGGKIGAPATVGIIVFTGILGAWLARQQGAQAWKRFRQTLALGGLPAKELLDGLLILLAGAVLITPGFFTDVVGFLLLLPPCRGIIRGFLTRYFKRKLQLGEIRFQSSSGPRHRPPGDDVPEMEAEVIDEDELE